MSKMKVSCCDQLTRCGLSLKQNRIATWLIVQVRFMPKTMSSYCDWLNQVQFVMKTRQNKDMINCIGVVYAKIETILSGPIWLCAVCDKNQTRWWHDRFYRCGPCRNWNWTVRTNRTQYGKLPKWDRTTTWSMVQVRFTSKIKLRYCDRLDRVKSMTKTKLDNDMTNHIDVIYAENKTKLSWSI